MRHYQTDKREFHRFYGCTWSAEPRLQKMTSQDELRYFDAQATAQQINNFDCLDLKQGLCPVFVREMI